MNDLMTPEDRRYYLFALRIVGDFGASIAIPVVVLVLIGQYIDHRFNWYPYTTIVSFIFAALISGKIIYQKAKKYGDQYQEMIVKK